MFKFARLSSRKWTSIIIHHSQSPENGVHTWDEIEQYHVNVQGWQGIGYNLGIERDNQGKYIYCIGRGLDCIGAHTKGMNEVGIGICMVGDYDKAEPLDIQYWLLAQICKDLMRDFDIPIENIQRHNEYNKEKSCPGLMFNMERLYDKIRNNGFNPPYNG